MAYTHACIHTLMHQCIHECIHVKAIVVCMCAYIYIHTCRPHNTSTTHTRIYIPYITWIHIIHTYMHNIHTCMSCIHALHTHRTHIHAYLHRHIRSHTCVHTATIDPFLAPDNRRSGRHSWWDPFCSIARNGPDPSASAMLLVEGLSAYGP